MCLKMRITGSLLCLLRLVAELLGVFGACGLIEWVSIATELGTLGWSVCLLFRCLWHCVMRLHI